MVALLALVRGRGRRGLRPRRTRGTGAALLILIPAYHAGSTLRPVRLPAHLRRGRQRLPGSPLRPSSPTARRHGRACSPGWRPPLLLGHPRRLEPAADRTNRRQRTSTPPRARRSSSSSACRTSRRRCPPASTRPASATLALDLLAAEVPSTRSAVLVTQDAEHLVPVALRGSTRAPWHIAEHVSEVLCARTRQVGARRGPLHRRARAHAGPSSCPAPWATGRRPSSWRSGPTDRPFTGEERGSRRGRDPADRADPPGRAALRHAAPGRQHRGAQPDRPRHPRRHRPGARRPRLPGRRPAGTGRPARDPGMRDGLDELRDAARATRWPTCA